MSNEKSTDFDIWTVILILPLLWKIVKLVFKLIFAIIKGIIYLVTFGYCNLFKKKEKKGKKEKKAEKDKARFQVTLPSQSNGASKTQEISIYVNSKNSNEPSKEEIKAVAKSLGYSAAVQNDLASKGHSKKIMNY